MPERARQQSEPGDFALPEAKLQQTVDAHFDEVSSSWVEIYESDDVYAIIHQRRRDVALRWIRELKLAPGSRILEVGCGAGLTAVELAQEGFDLDATDTAPKMLELTRRRAEMANVSPRLRAAPNDVHALSFEHETFDAVLALGVIPFLHSPLRAIREISRVLKPNGHFIGNVDNVARLSDFLDPLYNPLLRGPKEALKRLLDRLGLRKASEGTPSRKHSRREFADLLASAGLQQVKAQTLGFGPFTFLGRSILPGRLAKSADRWLQARAERGAPLIRSVGAQYLVIARKPAGDPS